MYLQALVCFPVCQIGISKINRSTERIGQGFKIRKRPPEFLENRLFITLHVHTVVLMQNYMYGQQNVHDRSNNFMNLTVKQVMLNQDGKNLLQAAFEILVVRAPGTTKKVAGQPNWSSCPT